MILQCPNRTSPWEDLYHVMIPRDIHAILGKWQRLVLKVLCVCSSHPGSILGFTRLVPWTFSPHLSPWSWVYPCHKLTTIGSESSKSVSPEQLVELKRVPFSVYRGTWNTFVNTTSWHNYAEMIVEGLFCFGLYKHLKPVDQKRVA